MIVENRFYKLTYNALYLQEDLESLVVGYRKIITFATRRNNFAAIFKFSNFFWFTSFTIEFCCYLRPFKVADFKSYVALG